MSRAAQTKRAPVKARVLLVEDDPRQQMLMKAMLQRHAELDVEVDVAASVLDALAVLETKRHDVCFLDLGLPDAFGTEAVRALRVAAPALPIVVVTGSEDPWNALASVKLGAVDFVVKDRLHPSTLLRSILVATRARKVPVDDAAGSAAEYARAGLVLRATDGGTLFMNAMARRLVAADSALLEVAKRLPLDSQGSLRVSLDDRDVMVLIDRTLIEQSGGQRELLTLTVASPTLQVLPRATSQSRRHSSGRSHYRGPERRSNAR